MTTAIKPQRATKERMLTVHTTLLERAQEAADKLPEGVCGRVQGVALTYDTADYFSTVFAPGCMAKSIAAKVPARKINVFNDHTKVVRSHVGVITEMRDIGDTAVFVCDLFDTDDGRRALEYAKAVMAAGAEVGVSIGFYPRKGEPIPSTAARADGGDWLFTEIELREMSFTPVPAVPGAMATGARSELDDDALLVIALRGIVQSLPPEMLDAELPALGLRRVEIAEQPGTTGAAATAASSDRATGGGTDTGTPLAAHAAPTATASANGDEADRAAKPAATMDERLTALRSTFT